MHSIPTHPSKMLDMTIQLTTAAEAERRQPRMYNRENKVGPTLLDSKLTASQILCSPLYTAAMFTGLHWHYNSKKIPIWLMNNKSWSWMLLQKKYKFQPCKKARFKCSHLLSHWQKIFMCEYNNQSTIPSLQFDNY